MGLSDYYLIINSLSVFNFTLSIITVIGFIIFLWKSTRDKLKFGINLKRVYCPICNTKQPIIRVPKNQQQALYGGTTCPNCQANLDKYGDIIS